MPLVDKEPSWAERRVVLFTSPVPERRRDRQWRRGRGECSESREVRWREGGYRAENLRWKSN